MKVLIVAAEPVGEQVINALTEHGVDEVRVIAPTLASSGLHFLFNDTDSAISHAEQVVSESVEAFDGSGIVASSDAPTDDAPEVSIDDAINEFRPERIVVLKHGPDDESYREKGLVEKIEALTDVPVIVRVVAVGADAT